MLSSTAAVNNNKTSNRIHRKQTKICSSYLHTSMVGSKHVSDETVKSPNIFERAKEEIQAVIHTEKMHLRHKETHGTSDIDVHTPLDNVKAPNVFERAKEEIEALIQSIHTNKDSENHEKRGQSLKLETESGIVKPSINLIERAKEEIEAIIHHDKSPHHHYKETHGRNDDIDEGTPIDEIKGPSIFQRAKEEVEALVEAIHPKKESNNFVSSPVKKEDGGFGTSIGRGLEKVCSPDKEGGFGASIGKGLEKVCSPKRD